MFGLPFDYRSFRCVVHLYLPFALCFFFGFRVFLFHGLFVFTFGIYRMEYENEGLLIELIQHYPLLFDKKNKEYKDNNLKLNAWTAMADAMSSTVEELQRMWLRLRERFSKERRELKEQASGSQAPESAWPLFDAMKFMEVHVQTRKRTTNIKSASRTPTPLSSPSGPIESPWSSIKKIIVPIIEEESENTSTSEAREPLIEPQAGPSGIQPGPTLKEPQAGPSGIQITPIKSIGETPKKRGRNSDSSEVIKKKGKMEIEESLSFFKNYLEKKNVEKRDRNEAFGEFVGLSLMDMGPEEQNFKRRQIMEILGAQYP